MNEALNVLIKLREDVELLKHRATTNLSAYAYEAVLLRIDERIKEVQDE